MSATIDNRVVQMEFDNSKFEKNMQTTTESLRKFKEGLNFEKSGKGLKEIAKGTKDIKTDGLARSVDEVTMRFSKLGIIGVTALARITNSAITTGTRLIKSLTIDQVTAGLKEYETQMGSVQTIQANTGASIKQINAALDDLNHYADKTIYNFSEMTRNIGTFTAAGVKLGPATRAIKGIANLAAVSGSTSQQASAAMYQLSQALAAGRVNLQDWNSVVNAGMGGKVFQKALERTGNAMGKNATQAIKMAGSFRESIGAKGGKQWLTAEVLTKTLEQFTMSAKKGSKEWDAFMKKLQKQGYTKKQATEILNMANVAEKAATKVKTFSQLMDTLKEAVGSQWALTFRYLFGDFAQARKMWTAVNDELTEFLTRSGEQRNALLAGWSKLGGRDDLLASISNLWKAFRGIYEAIRKARLEIFPPTTAKELANMTHGVRKFTEMLIPSKSTLEGITSVFKVLFSVWKAALSILLALPKAVIVFVKEFANLGGFSKSFKVLAISAKFFLNVIKQIGAKLAKNLPDIHLPKMEAAASVLNMLAQKFLNFTKSVMTNKTAGVVAAKIFEGISFAIKHLSALMDYIVPKIKSLGAILAPVFNSAFGWVKDAASSGFSKLIDIIKTLFNQLSKFTSISGITSVFKQLFTHTDRLASTTKEFSKSAYNSAAVKYMISLFNTLGNAIKNAAIKMKDSITNTEAFKQTLSTLSKFANLTKTGIRATSAVVGKWNTKAINQFAMLIEAMKNSLKNFNIINIAISFLKIKMDLILSKLKMFAVNAIAALKWLKNTIAKLLSNIDWGKVGEVAKKSAMGIIAGIYAHEVRNILKGIRDFRKSITDVFKSISKSFDGFGNAMNELAGVFKQHRKNLKADYIIKLAIALGLLALSLRLLSKINAEGMATGLIGVAFLLGMLVTSVRAMSKIKIGPEIFKGTMAFLGMSVAIRLLAGALAKLSNADPLGLTLAMVGLAVSLGVFVGLMKYISSLDIESISKIKSITPALLLLSFAVKIMAGAFAKMATVNTEDLISGAVGMIIILAGMAAFAWAIQEFVKSTAGLLSVASAMIMLGVAILIFVGGIKLLSMIPWDEFGSGAEKLAILLTILAAFVKFAGGNTLLSVGVGIVLISVALYLIIGAIAILGSMGLSQMAQGVIGVGISLLFVAAAIKVIGGMAGKALSASVAILIVSVALELLADGIGRMGSLPFGTLIQGIIGLLVVLQVMYMFMNAMSNMQGLAGGAVFIAIAAGLTILAVGLSILAAIPLLSIVVAILAVAGALLLFAALAAVLTPLVVPMLILGAVLLMIGAAMALAGLGVMLFTAGLSALIPLLYALGTISGETVNKGLQMMGSIINELCIGSIKLGLSMAILGLGLIIAAVGGFLVGAALTIIGIGALVAAIGITALTGAIALFASVASLSGKQIVAGFKALFAGLADAILGVIQFVVSKIPFIGDSLASKMDGVRDKLKKSIGKEEDGRSAMDEVKKGVQSGGKDLKDTLANVGKGQSKGLDARSEFQAKGRGNMSSFVSGLNEGKGKASGKGKEAAKSAASGLDMKSVFSNAGKGNMDSFTGAIGGSGAKGKAKSAGKSVAGEAKSGMGSVKFGSAGKDAAEGFAIGMRNNVSTVRSAGSFIGDEAYRAAKRAIKSKSPAKKFIELGMYSDQGLAIGMYDFANLITKAGRFIGNKAIDTTRSALTKFNDLINFDEMSDPIIRPVVDMSNIEASQLAIESAFDGFNITPTVDTSNISPSSHISATRSAFGDLANKLNGFASAGTTYSFGDITMDASDLEDVATIEDFVEIIRRAKNF